MNDKYIAVDSKTTYVKFLVKVCKETEDYFKRAIESKNYIFSKDVLILKAMMIRDGGHDGFEFHQISSEGLKGLIKRVSMKEHVNEDVDDLIVLYFPNNNSFVFKESNGEISHSFDYFLSQST